MMKKNELLNKFKYILIFAFASISLEIVAFGVLGFGILPTYFLFDFAYILIISSILFLMEKRKNKLILIITILSVQAILNVVNASYFMIFGDIFSFDMFKLAGEATKVFKLSFINYKSIGINAVMLLAFILVLISSTKNDKELKNKKQKDKNRAKYIQTNFTIKRKRSFAFVLALFLAFVSTGFATNVAQYSLLADSEVSNTYYIAESDSYLYQNLQFKQKAYQKFGTFGFYLKNLEDQFNKDTNLDGDEIAELQNFIDDGIVEANPNAPLHGKNLIVIMLESFDWFAIDPYCTPTIYKMATETGYCFRNFRANNKTNMSENIGMLGNFPRQTNFQSLAKTTNFAPKNSLAYMFKDLGYDSKYFHSYDINFYNRNIVNKKLGFDSLYGIQNSGLGKNVNFGYAYLEEDFLNTCIEDFAPEDKSFFSFYTTFGTHGGYDKFNQRYSKYFELYENNIDKITEYFIQQGFHMPTDRTYYNYLKEFKCAAMDTDKMISNLLDYLNEKGLLDKTTIMLYADHNCYYDNTNLMIKNGNKVHDYADVNLYNIPFIIYDADIGNGINNTFCSTYDIYPTICELFGLEYNKNLVQGNNVFGDNIQNSVFVSSVCGMFNDRIYSDDILTISSEHDLTNEEITAFQLNAINFYEKQNKIDKIYLNNLINRK